MNNQGLEALAALASKAQLSEEPAAEGRQPAASESTTNNLAAAAGARTAPAPATTTTSLAAEIQQSLPTALQYSLGGTSAAAAAASTAQLQQALAASGLGIPAGMPAAASNIAFLAGMQQQLPQTDNSGLLAMQQLAYYQYLMGQQQQQANDSNAAAAAAAALQQQQQRANSSATCTKVGDIDANQAAALAALTGQTALAKQLDASQVGALRQVLPNGQQEVVAGSPPLLPSGGGGGGAGPATAMPPPQVAAAPASSQPIAVSTQGVQPPTSAAAAAASKPASIAPQPTVTEKAFLDDQNAYYEAHLKDKKHQKRAANRRSAQLSRKRKKQFIEELKEENDDLRRKEQILMSIPDLIVVFDSSGKLWFVSQSVSRFLQFSSTELEGTSFWDCLCEDSVRLLKAAFMDSLAARQPGSDSAPLGSGFWELRLVDKDRTQIVVTLNGVVHFTGDRPECVCSIRPRDQHAADDQTNSATVTVSSKGSSHVAGGAGGPTIRVRVEPQQSVVSNSSSSSDSDKKPAKQSAAGAVRISDRGSSSGESESGSSDELVAAS